MNATISGVKSMLCAAPLKRNNSFIDKPNAESPAAFTETKTNEQQFIQVNFISTEEFYLHNQRTLSQNSFADYLAKSLDKMVFKTLSLSYLLDNKEF